MRSRRTEAAETPPEGTTGDAVTDRPSGATPRKGRPTPTKAEAAARNRQPLVVSDRKAAKRRAREERNKYWALQQQAMRTGDEQYLPVRDRGPVRRAARDWIDARFLPSQLFLPGAFVIMLSMLVVGQFFPGTEGYVVLAMCVLLLFSITVSVIAVHLMKRRLVAEFGEKYRKGTVWYAFLRAMYPRFLRQPRPQVAIGGGPVKRKDGK